LSDGVSVPATALRAYRRLEARTLREALVELAAERPALIVLRPLTHNGSVELAALDQARGGTAALACLLVLDPAACEALRAAPPTRPALAWVSTHASAAEIDLLAERLRREVELLAELETLRHRALHDDLTGLLRPLAFDERLRAHYSAAQRHRFPIALLLLDLDNFRVINKRYDHVVGDRVIRDAAGALRAALRVEDVAGRLGGDEFAVCLPYTTPDSAELVAERVRAAIVALSRQAGGGGGELRVSASIGLETFDGRDLPSLQVLRLHAERALRAAKQAGGNQVRGYRTLSAEATPDGS
jgi:diguanylate cyclase (GGDEF)-like protein